MPTDYSTPTPLARELDISPQAVHGWLIRHPGLGYKIGARWRIRPEVAAAIAAGTPLVEAARLGRAGR